ncbi:MAG: coenzyme F430 synthase [Methanobrevibacter sp.]|jgi:UDP-N-acetylmuramyl pentapeptide synthase|nr:coenzyme F430 synthase [Candidatus Methanovirga australis]
MDALVVDLTHGGVTIAIKLAKLDYFNNIYVFDLYKTLKNHDKKRLLNYDMIIIEDIDELNGNNQSELLISYPIHSPIKPDEIRKKTKHPKGLNLTHHKTVEFILKQWKKRMMEEKKPIIEVTGVKGKTTTVSLLESILKDYNPLTLTSLGATLDLDNKNILLKKNISITPASILETIDLVEKRNNCEYSVNSLTTKDKKLNSKLTSKNPDYSMAIFESSLGTSGIGDIGILTNIIENYKIAKNTLNAKIAKEQVFDNEYVVIDYDTLIKFYPEKVRDKINSFKLKNYNMYDENEINPNTDIQPNLIANKVKYDLENSEIEIKYENIKTINGNELNGELNVKTCLLGEYNILNVLGAVTVALTLGIDEEKIKGLKNFNPVEGRGSIRLKDNIKIIEEINPGLNVKAIEKVFGSIKDLKKYSIILGGKYGVTCEEINETDLSKLLDKIIGEYNCDLTLVDDLGKSLKNKIKNKVKFFEDHIEAQEIAIEKGKDILLIYRSNYSQIYKR